MLPNLSGLALPTENRLGDKAKAFRDGAVAAGNKAAGKAKEAVKAGVEQGKLWGGQAKKKLEEKAAEAQKEVLRKWVKETGLTKSNAPALLFAKANEIYKKAYSTDIPQDQADKIKQGLNKVFEMPSDLSIASGDGIWTSETADERRQRQEAEQKVLERSAIEFFFCFLGWCFDMAMGSESSAGLTCKQYGF